MTTPDRTTWTVAEDGEVEPTLWHGRTAVLRRRDISAGGRTLAEATAYGDLLWDLLRHVLAPDEGAIDRVALGLCPEPRLHLQGCPVFTQRSLRHRDPCDCHWSKYARHALAALAGTSAQARHTDGETGGA